MILICLLDQFQFLEKYLHKREEDYTLKENEQEIQKNRLECKIIAKSLHIGIILRQ